MASATPTTIAHYRLTAKLGAGGMGEVWRATDTKLQREVAIKLLPPVFASDPGRLARFTREAHVLASLNHPNIAHVYGVEQNALVMELVEGETLAERIARGPLPLDEALPIASQIADGLEYAHDNGIVHRDLKPANIKLTPDGKVKVLDFGLAKAVATDTTTEVSASAPTLTTPATLAGAILGTAAYMAPEQAKGRPVDRRADIWAYGVVLYEMLVGRRPFLGDDISDTLAAVLRSEPDLDPLPARLRPPIARSLKKDPRQRWGCIGDLRHALLEEQPPPTAAPAAARRSFWLAAASGAPIVLLALFLGWWLRPPPPAPVGRFRFALPSGQAFTRGSRHVVAISADGSKIAYVANQHLYVRALNALNAQPIPGGPTDPAEPVISPDGQWVAYFSAVGASSLLQKLPLAGGAPVTLCQLKGVVEGASWSDGRIVFGDYIPGGYSAIESVPASGGAPQVLATAPAGAIATDPQLVDHGRRVLFAVIPGIAMAAADNGQIVVQDFGAPSSRRTLLTGGTNPLLLASGQLAYVHAGVLYGLAFDASRGAVRGGPVPLVEDITQTNGEGAGQIAVSATGTLVYWPGGTGAQQRVLVWVDQQGREQPLAAPSHPYDYPRLSPDGKRIAVNFVEVNGDIWIWDTIRSTLSRLTFGPGAQFYPYWSADGREVYYDSAPGLTLFRKPADGTGAAAAVGVGATAVYYVSPDGKLALLRSPGAQDGLMLELLPASASPKPLLTDPKFDQYNAAVSPNGRWVAYQSNESGQFEVYVRPFPAVNGGRWQISTTTGTTPAWSRDGRQLFYVAGAGASAEMMAVPVETGSASFSAAAPKALFSYAPYSTATGRTWDVSASGRFLLVKPVGAAVSESLEVVTNWAKEVTRRIPQK